MGRETKKGLVVEVTISGTLVSTSRYNPTGRSLATVLPLSLVGAMAVPPLRMKISRAFFTVVELASRLWARALFSVSEV